MCRVEWHRLGGTELKTSSRVGGQRGRSLASPLLLARKSQMSFCSSELLTISQAASLAETLTGSSGKNSLELHPPDVSESVVFGRHTSRVRWPIVLIVVHPRHCCSHGPFSGSKQEQQEWRGVSVARRVILPRCQILCWGRSCLVCSRGATQQKLSLWTTT